LQSEPSPETCRSARGPTWLAGHHRWRFAGNSALACAPVPLIWLTRSQSHASSVTGRATSSNARCRANPRRPMSHCTKHSVDGEVHHPEGTARQEGIRKVQPTPRHVRQSNHRGGTDADKIADGWTPRSRFAARARFYPLNRRQKAALCSSYPILAIPRTSRGVQHVDLRSRRQDAHVRDHRVLGLHVLELLLLPPHDDNGRHRGDDH
jgi:hypothetical protein